MGLFSWLFGSPSTGEHKMCRNKVRYRNYPEAQTAINRINPTRQTNMPNRYYKCPHCNGYHITKSPKK